ncbi:lipopolysaccharide assembly protein LapB [Chloracidobacterium thermophilum]|uniref:tetratricopeptide repeat protein n=1 Tax=Chloracidobacterium thermophilum TaxID=458033 RepID=UPI0007389629|nr:tetratricopeptide repeat protein [Chloracidobacterium thermophilum]
MPLWVGLSRPVGGSDMACVMFWRLSWWLAGLSVCLVWLGGCGVLAAPPGGVGPRPASDTPAATETFEQVRTRGFDALYNLDYRGAWAAFEQLTRIEPTHPAGYLYLANCMWAEKLYRTRRLQATTYTGETFFADTKEVFDKDFDRRLREAVDRTLQVADARLRENPRDTVALYYKGMAHGLLAAYEATITRAFLAALSQSNKAVALHREVLKLDPDYADANLSIGLYNYVVGSLPLPVKVIAALGGVRGSKKRGLALVAKAADEGRTAQDAARLLLITLYKREKRYADAMSYLETFTRQYPANYVARLELADTLVRLGRMEEGIARFEELTKEDAAGPYRDAIHYQLADVLFSVGRVAEAVPHFRRVLTLPNANADLVTLAQLRLGEAHDVLGQRAEAVQAYRAVLKRPNVFDVHARAQAHLKKPYVATTGTVPPASSGQVPDEPDESQP